WRANGAVALAEQGLVATRLAGGSERVEFRYFPRTLRWSLPLWALTVLGAAWQPRWNRFLERIFRSRRT
ncbi:MAG TPA: hypothetical protein VGQ57_04365, partial [Polyangiaceae bacterium]|nr:hypothetical protein [Polyangiaceae bacterium]